MWIIFFIILFNFDISGVLTAGETFLKPKLGDRPVLSEEKKLLHLLLERYRHVGRQGRPIMDLAETINVKFGLGLIQMSLDEKEKALCISVWTKMVWEDAYLSWDPIDHANITSVKLESNTMWIPDIMLYNTAETDTPSRDTLATVYYNGTILWVPHRKLKSSCSIDVTHFPFDKQQCHMWFGSWTYPTQQINLTMAFEGGMDLSTFRSDFKETSQWDITHLESARRILPTEDELPNYAVLTFTLELQRNLVFASYILTLPCVFLACLTLAVFWLPPDRPDRTSLAMSIFASFLLLLLILVEAAPPTAKSVPLLGVYYGFNMVIIMLAIFLSTLVVNVCRRGENKKRVPWWLRKLTLEGPVHRLCHCHKFFPFILFKQSENKKRDEENYIKLDLHCYTKSKSQKSAKIIFRKEKQSKEEQQGDPETRQGHHSVLDQTLSADRYLLKSTKNDLHKKDKFDHCCLFEKVVRENMTLLKDATTNIESYLSHKAEEEHLLELCIKEWKTVAITLDRIFFITYIIIIILSLVNLFPRP